MYRLLQTEEINRPQNNPIEFSAIGDLYGELMLTKKRLNNLMERGVDIGQSPLIFMGDIIGDRGIEGMDILLHIHRIRESLPEEKADQNIQILAGNHDLWAMMFFAFANDVRRHPENVDYRESRINFFTGLFYGWPGEMHLQGHGISEFSRFLPAEKNKFKVFGRDMIRNLFLNGPEILQNMHKSPEGKTTIKELVSMKLCTQVRNTLFFHTPPTMQAIAFLERYDFNVEAINTEWQMHIGNIFSPISRIFDDCGYLDNIGDSILDTDNRFKNSEKHEKFGVFSREQADKMKERGIERIVYGHDWIDEGFYERFHGIELVGIDYGKTNPKAFVQKKFKGRGFAGRVFEILSP